MSRQARRFILSYAGILSAYVALVLAVGCQKVPVTPEQTWRTALWTCRSIREAEVCQPVGTPDCDVVRMANSSGWMVQKPADELRRCLEPGAGLHLKVGALER